MFKVLKLVKEFSALKDRTAEIRENSVVRLVNIIQNLFAVFNVCVCVLNYSRDKPKHLNKNQA